MSPPPPVTHFASPAAFRRWLAAHHRRAAELADCAAGRWIVQVGGGKPPTRDR